jgi:hypothetical protein
VPVVVLEDLRARRGRQREVGHPAGAVVHVVPLAALAGERLDALFLGDEPEGVETCPRTWLRRWPG